ncbi:hypothetical protein BBJ28_00005296, partial [Nothophytophthora sp. Chile5]
LFLENDFSTERWCYAAAKNAYSLLSKKRYEEAAAFFLLCEPPRIQEAVRVLAVRLGDPSLALVIARLVEYRTSDSFQQEFINTATQAEITPAGDVTKQLLEQDVIPLFRRKHEKWLESCALWWLEDFEQACAVLLPQSQEVDIYEGKDGHLLESMDLVSCATRATHFYINLTSVTVYFQYLHSSVNSPLLHWAMKKMQQQAFPGVPVSPLAVSASRRRHQLASTADIEHAFSFAAYVCKRSGLSDTALVEMLQARHLVNIHARFEISTMESSTDTSNRILEEEEDGAFAKGPTSPRFRQRIRRGSDLSCITGASGSPDRAAWRSSPRRLSFAEESISFPSLDQLVTGKKTPLRRATTVNWSRALQSEKLLPSAPWLKAQIADIECRRWASSAFVGKMIGLRVAREMISHFRAELDLWFRCGDDSDAARSPKQRPRHAKLHREFLEELCTPLCEQFQMDRKYLYEAALAVMHPHAYLHIVEVCFLLSELERASTLRKWIQYVSLSMLHSCSTFASCSIAEDVYRDWEGLTIQLCYILNLDAQGQVKIPPQVIAQINVAVRTGSIFLGWAKHRSDLVREAVTLPFYTYGGNEDASTKKPVAGLSSFAWEKNLDLIRKLQQGVAASASAKRGNRTFEGSLGYTFLGTVASHLLDDDSISLLSWGGMHQATNHHQFKIRKMYTLILMVSVLRTLYARAKLFLSTFKDGSVDAEDEGKEDISSSLFTPQKLWKALGEGPLEGIRRWYALIESHLRCEFDYSVKEVQCLCGLYGLDHAVFEEAAAANSAQKLLDDQERDQVNGDEASNGGLEGGEVVGRQPEGGDVDGEPLNADIATVAIEEHAGEISDALAAFLREIGMSWTLHLALVATSDDYILLLMQHARFGVRTTFRRFRMDPRVYVKSFVLREAFNWFAQHQIFSRGSTDCVVEAHAFLTRCCKQRKLRLLVAHRGEDAQMFPLDHPHTPSSQSNTAEGCTSTPSELQTDQTSRSEPSEPEPMSEATYQQSMMFVDPWEIEAEWNVRRYMHNMEAPLHVELGWDRLSPICLETCDGIIESVFKDPDLVAMWKTTGGEGWLVTAITQYQLDSMYSYRTHHQHTRLGLGEKEEPKIPFLVEIHSRSQRNAMFQEAGLPHRFVGVVTVELVEAKDLIACSWVGHWSDAYVFLQLSHPGDELPSTAEEWSLQTYRSCVGEGGVNPRWSAAENKFTFRFAIPTHCSHVVSPIRGNSSRGGGDAMARRKSTMLWDANVIDSNRSSVEALEALLPSVFSGPPTVLRCAVYQKNKVLSHQFMGSAKSCPIIQLASTFHLTKAGLEPNKQPDKPCLLPATGGEPLSMELGGWRSAVPYGAYLQPIHLTVAGSDAESAVLPPVPSVASVASPAAQETSQTNQKPSDSPTATSSEATGLETAPATTEPPPHRPTPEDPVKTVPKNPNIVVLPPFASECLNGGEQMALNVGGPVWAMDWLPQRAASTADATANLGASSSNTGTQKRGRRKPAVAKGRRGKTAQGKENNKSEDAADQHEATPNAGTNSRSTIEWRFLALATHPPCQVADGKLMKPTPPDHYYDVQEGARNLLQIWAVPVHSPNPVGAAQQSRHKTGKSSERPLVKPRLVYAIDHDSGVAWDLQWCPLAAKLSHPTRPNELLGVLAVCFGDGSLRIFEVPKVPEERLQPQLSKEAMRLVEKCVPVVIAKLPRILQIRDSVFKLWDIREPRLCLRSHRIRSTWGLALQWMDHTSIQISGDQGSIYMYDILVRKRGRRCFQRIRLIENLTLACLLCWKQSGSYQKLHFHPQIDSPVWDLQFGRRGAVPLLVSSCTSGSIRAAPAKKLYRAPQNCVEICRLTGHKDASVEQPFKALSVSFKKRTVLGSAEAVSPATREFCERDAALHRLRLTSSTTGEYPCYLAAAGHAGLVLLLEMQEVLDNLITTYFLPPSKKIGRPKKIFATSGGHRASKKVAGRKAGGVPVAAISGGRKARTLGSFAKAKGMHTALSKYKKKALKTIKLEPKAKRPRAREQVAVEEEDGEDEGVEEEEEEEAEYEGEEDEDDVSDSELSLMMDDNSDDDRVSVSDDEEEEEESAPTTELNAEESRLMTEYQMDLSEEDAYLLAIQMSQVEQAAPAASAEVNGSSTAVASPAKLVLELPPKRAGARKSSSAAKAKIVAKGKAKAKVTKGKKRRLPSKSMEEEAKESTAVEDSGAAEQDKKGEERSELVADGGRSSGSRNPPTSSPMATKKANQKQPRKMAAKNLPDGARTRRSPPVLDQAMALQMFKYQMGLTEEDALKEAIRLSEMGDKRRSTRAKHQVSHLVSDEASAAAPTPTRRQKSAATPRTQGASQQKQPPQKAKQSENTSSAGSTDASSQQQRPQTPRRLRFSPLNASVEAESAAVPAASIDGDDLPADAAVKATTVSPKRPRSVRKEPPELVGLKQSEAEEKAEKALDSATKTGKKKRSTAKAPVAASVATPQAKRAAKRPRSTGAKAAVGSTASKKRKKSADALDVELLSEEDALLMALKMSEIEY